MQSRPFTEFTLSEEPRSFTPFRMTSEGFMVTKWFAPGSFPLAEISRHRDLDLVLRGGAAVPDVDFPGGILAEVVEDHFDQLRLEPLLPLLHPHLAVLIAVIIVREDGFQGEPQSERLFFLKHVDLTFGVGARRAVPLQR